MKAKYIPKLLLAAWRREPWGHICDLWSLFTGRCEVRGKPPYEYLLVVDSNPEMKP